MLETRSCNFNICISKVSQHFVIILFQLYGIQIKYIICSCRKSKKYHHHYAANSYNFEDHGWNGASKSLSRILQTVDDVTFQVVDVKKKHKKKRRKKIRKENDSEKRGDSIFIIIANFLK